MGCYFQSHRLSRPSSRVTHRVRQKRHKLARWPSKGEAEFSQSLNKSNSSCIAVAPPCLGAFKDHQPKLQRPPYPQPPEVLGSSVQGCQTCDISGCIAPYT